MNYTHKALLAILGIFAFLAVFVLAFYLPESNRLDRLRQRGEELKRTLEELQVKGRNLTKVRLQVSGMQEKLSRLEEQYPRSIESVYSSLNEASRRHRITILNMRAAELKEQPEPDIVRLWEISIEGKSAYNDLGEFLAEIARLPVLVTISGLHLEGGPGEEDGEPLESFIGLTAYLSREDGETQTE